MSLVTVAICTRDRVACLGRALRSVAEQSVPGKNFELLIVDNGSDDAATRTYQPDYPRARFVREEVRGVAHARDRAVRECETEWIAFLDDDSRAEPAWLEELLSVLSDTPARVAAVGGRVLPEWGIARPAWLGDALLPLLSVIDWGGTHARQVSDTQYFAGTNLALRVGAVMAAGGFDLALGRVADERVLISNEEIDLVQRLCRAGGIALYAPLAVVHHHFAPDRLTKAWFLRRAAWQAVSDMRSDPDATEGALDARWAAVEGFVGELPPAARGLDSFWADSDDPALFARQVWAVYGFTLAMLLGRCTRSS